MVNTTINLELTLAINLRNARLSGLWFLGVAHEGSLVASDHCEGVGGVDIDTDRGLATLVIGVSHEPAAWLGCWVAWASVTQRHLSLVQTLEGEYNMYMLSIRNQTSEGYGKKNLVLFLCLVWHPKIHLLS